MENMILGLIVFILLATADLIFVEPELKKLHNRLDNNKK